MGYQSSVSEHGVELQHFWVQAPSLKSNFCEIERRINKNIQYRHAMWIELRNWLQFGHDKTQSSATTNRRLGYLPSISELAASIGY